MEALDTGRKGLTNEEARRRLERYGPNEVEAERPVSGWTILLHQFRDPLIYILLIAAAITIAIGDLVDSGVIIAVVLINAIIGFIQEYRAGEAMSALQKMSAPRATVMREGRQTEIQAVNLVPGDVVLLTSGDRVAADVRMMEVQELEADESALTGESLAVRKTVTELDEPSLVAGDQTNMAFAGTVITRGRGRGVVVHTGADTDLGRIATSIREMVATSTPLQRKLNALGTRIGVAILVLSLVVIGIGLLQRMPLADVIVATVALAVATIPEGLPVVLTVTLAIGVRRMARRNAIIRSLPAVETLGSTTVIGSDKTGTLTRNEMSVRALWVDGIRYTVSGSGYAAEGEIIRDDAPVDARDHPGLYQTLLGGVLANEADPQSVREGQALGDPTEVALYVAAAKGGIDATDLRERHAEVTLLPFESERRLMASLREMPHGRTIYVKGAPEAVIALCQARAGRSGPTDLRAEEILAAGHDLAAEGLRVLAVACREAAGSELNEETLGDDFVLAGLQGMEDPVRPEAVDAVAAAHDAGIRVVMLTGDHVDTARAIGRQLGIGSADARAVDGAELSRMSPEEISEVAASVDIFARVAPEHKLAIVKSLKDQDQVVAVTGDGVNDAPALRAADIGIAMGRTGTEVAREASDMVLADDNFATITAAVEEGRVVFANIRKVTFFLLSTGVAMPITIIVALLAGLPLPFIAVQILWINLVTNGMQDVALAFEPGEPGLLSHPPRSTHEGIVTRRILWRLGGVGVVLAAGTLGMFIWTLRETDDLALAQSAAMTQMVVFQFFHVFNCRSLDRSIFVIPPFSNRFLFAAVVGAVMAQLAVLHVPLLQTIFRTEPLPLAMWGWILLIGSAVTVGGELDKLVNRRSNHPLG
jgi:potassium/sodium efflux P-type ATPase